MKHGHYILYFSNVDTRINSSLLSELFPSIPKQAKHLLPVQLQPQSLSSLYSSETSGHHFEQYTPKMKAALLKFRPVKYDMLPFLCTKIRSLYV